MFEITMSNLFKLPLDPNFDNEELPVCMATYKSLKRINKIPENTYGTAVQ